MIGRMAFSVAALAIWAAATPVVAQQAGKIYRIGYLSVRSLDQEKRYFPAFRQGLQERGYIEGENIVTRYLWANRKRNRLAVLAAELIRDEVDIIVTGGGAAARAVQKLTKTIPIVMAEATAPVARGLVESLARPGGNTTGLSLRPPELFGKQLELLRETVPRLSRVAVLWNAKGPASKFAWMALQNPARQLGLQLHSMEVRGADDFDSALRAALDARVEAIYITPGPRVPTRLYVELSARSGLPTIYVTGRFVRAGGLMSYGTTLAALYHRAASFVDRILKGAKPADLPVEQPTKFELVVNLKTARQIGVTIPNSILLRADEVIE